MKLSPQQEKQFKARQAELGNKLKAFKTLEKLSPQQADEVKKIEAELTRIKEALEAEDEGPMVIAMPDEAANYVVPKGEEHYVHIRMFIGNRFDPITGEETTSYTIQKFNVTDFKNFEKQAPRLGYHYGFLHKPAGFKSIYAKK